MSVDPPLMDPMAGGEDGIARIKDIGGVYVPTGTGIRDGGVMVWEAIICNELVGPFKVSDGVKATAELYIKFIKEHLVPSR